MKKKNVTKHALFFSIISMLLCSTMFVGTTFAWFTDSVTSDNNIIESGTLDVDLQMYNAERKVYESIADKEGTIFTNEGNGINWEPGKTEVVYLKIQNTGNLNLKYDFLLTVVDGGLIGSLDYVMIEGDYSAAEKQFASWEQVKTKWEEQQNSRSASTVIPNLYEGVITADQGKLMPNDETTSDDEKCFALAIHMKDDAENKFQGKTVTIDASVFATQAFVEEDSFNANYDSAATYSYVKYTQGTNFLDLWNSTQEGNTIYLESEDGLILDSLVVDKNMTIDAAGRPIKLANGLNFSDGKSLTIKNTKAESLAVTGNGTLVLYGSIITATTEEVSALTLNNSNLNLVVKGYTVLTGATNGEGIHVGAGSVLDLSGTGKLVAIGNAGTEDKSARVGGNGIGGEGVINIHDMANLTAEGYGVAGFGIGGKSTNINIKNTIIQYAKGGFVQQNLVNDTKYGKTEPEGGAAIGSMTDGATISLEKVTIEKAEGGSKAAGIGARYWTAVTINISDSTIKEVIGGNASAGIGGSRIKDTNQEAQTVDITIANSTVNAKGGEYGAGIGSGYDTHCSHPSPICTINITGTSKISAEGGKYAAGIGTGYHAGGLAGGIESTVEIIKAVSGEKFYKTEYTQAQDIGFGVVDPTREGQTSATCSFNDRGTTITVPTP